MGGLPAFLEGIGVGGLDRLLDPMPELRGGQRGNYPRTRVITC
jgi:hypothetical protein